mmetsp:Transcript_1995/g.3961  ORF Transcript_1995/g.3961 Transcript_1995/m.3961 type:complete len:85 (+) Transcript_1995:4012-4266(+)
MPGKSKAGGSDDMMDNVDSDLIKERETMCDGVRRPIVGGSFLSFVVVIQASSSHRVSSARRRKKGQTEENRPTFGFGQVMSFEK